MKHSPAHIEAEAFRLLAKAFTLFARVAEKRDEEAPKRGRVDERSLDQRILDALPARDSTEAYERAGIPRPWYAAGQAWRYLRKRGIIQWLGGRYVEAAKVGRPR